MENHPNTIGALFEDAGDYLETRIDLIKLKAIDKSSEAASSLVTVLIVILIAIFAISILNIGLALWVGELLGKTYLGFFAVAGFYILIALLLHFFRRSWIKDPITGMLIKKMLN